MRRTACAMRETRALRRFFRTPKGLLILILVLLTAMAAPASGARRIWPGLFGAVLTAGLLDVVILRVRHPRWEIPSGAMLTALIVAMVLSPFEPWWVPAA